MAERKRNEATAEPSPALRLEIVRIFDAPRKLVYTAWTTPEHLAKWSAPEGFTIPEATTNFQKGGTYYAHMRSPAGEDHRVQGKDLEIVEGKRIVMTHAGLNGACNIGPETTITVTFEDLGDKTRMTFVQEGFASAASRDGHEQGWNSCFNLLAVLLERLRPGREIIITRLLNAPRALVFAAFKDPDHITNWWGPNGFSTTTYEMDFRPGGLWLFTMHGPDGTDYPNRVR
ncbi:MAG TPA: SRPBCC family protein, partial [Hyphomicrobium sp.]